MHHAFYSFIFEPDQATRWEQTQEILGQFMQQRFLGNNRMPHWPLLCLDWGWLFCILLNIELFCIPVLLLQCRHSPKLVWPRLVGWRGPQPSSKQRSQAFAPHAAAMHKFWRVSLLRPFSRFTCWATEKPRPSTLPCSMGAPPCSSSTKPEFPFSRRGIQCFSFPLPLPLRFLLTLSPMLPSNSLVDLAATLVLGPRNDILSARPRLGLLSIANIKANTKGKLLQKLEPKPVQDKYFNVNTNSKADTNTNNQYDLLQTLKLILIFATATTASSILVLSCSLLAVGISESKVIGICAEPCPSFVHFSEGYYS